MKKVIYISFILIIICNFMNLFYNISYAKDDKIDALAKQGESVTPSDENDDLFVGINKIIGLLQIVGTGISIIVVSILGIKYMLASPGEKADVKKNIMPIIIGCILVFGGVNVVAIIAKFSTGVFGSGK